MVDDSAVVPDILVDREVDQRPEIQQTIEQVNQKRALLNQIAAVSAQADQDPRYRRTEQEIEQLEATLASLRDVSRPRIRSEMEAMAGLERRQKLESLRTQLSTQSLVVENLRANYDAMVKDLALSGSQTLDLRMKQRELDRRQGSPRSHLGSRRPAGHRDVCSAASRTDSGCHWRPKSRWNRCPGSNCWLPCWPVSRLPFGICALWEKSVRRVTSIEQLQHEAALPVVGEIARLPMRQARKPDASTQP